MKHFFAIALGLISLNTFAQRYEIGRATETFNVKASTTSKELNLAIPMYRIDERMVVETVSCRVPQCSTEIGDGSEGNWHGYFSVKISDKPEALAAAIKGIGPTTAEKIVKFNLLKHKPDSWTDFSRTIRRIEKQLEDRGYNYKFSTQVLEVYGYDNLIGLGYGNEKSCRYIDTFCNVASLKEFKTLSHYLNRSLIVDIKNQSLQTFETDTITISAGTQANDIRFSVSGHNNYNGSIYRNGAILELDGTRIKKSLPVSEVLATLSKDGQNNFKWGLRVPVKYSAEDQGSDIEVTYELCREGLFGNCSYTVGGPWKEIIKNNLIERTIFTSTLVPGKRYFVRARLNKVNSSYYSSSLSEYVKTETLRR
jgi:hypothetical protein